jgi:hypothetical protein
LYFRDPLLEVLEAVVVGDIIDENGSSSGPVVASGDGAERLLSSL